MTVWDDDDIELLMEKIQFALSEIGILVQITEESAKMREYSFQFMEKLGDRGEKEGRS